MSYITILSNDIKVYPSGFRTNNPETGVWIDPEARLNTEFNISHSGGSIKGKDSYVINNNVLSNGIYYVECVIHGYYFNFNIAANTLTEQLGSTSELKTIYAKIKVGTVSILDDDENFLTKKLIPFTGDDYDSKDQVSGSYYFQALILSNETSSNANIISLPLWTIFWAEGRGEYIIKNIQASFFTETATHIESEDSSIPITNRLVNGTGNGAVKAISAEEASGTNSIAIGTGTKATIEGSFAVGKYNIGGKLFEVGGGTSSQRKDLFSIDTSGKTDLIGQFDIKDDSGNNAISVSKNNRAAAIYKLLVDANVDDSNFWQDYEQEPNTTAALLVDPTATGANPKVIIRGRTEIRGDTTIDGKTILQGQYLTVNASESDFNTQANFYGNGNFYESATFKNNVILPKINKITFGEDIGTELIPIYINNSGKIQKCTNILPVTTAYQTVLGKISATASSTLPTNVTQWNDYTWSPLIVTKSGSDSQTIYNIKLEQLGDLDSNRWLLIDITTILKTICSDTHNSYYIANISVLPAATNERMISHGSKLEINSWVGNLTINGANNYYVGLHRILDYGTSGNLGYISIEIIATSSN